MRAKGRTKRSIASALALLVGVLVLVGVAVTLDVGAVMDAIAALGWGIAVISVYRVFSLAFEAGSWRCLIVPRPSIPFGFFVCARWVGESVNSLLPVAQVGGDVVRARLLSLRGLAPAQAAAVGVADFTLGLVAQLLFTLVGAGAYLLSPEAPTWGRPLALGLVVVLVLVFCFIWLQHFNPVRWLASNQLGKGMADAMFERLQTNYDAFHRALVATYAETQRLVQAITWKLVGWVVRSGETWLFFAWLGEPITLLQVFVLESLSYAVRSAAFAIPGAVGAQEAGIILVGTALGFPVELVAALALTKRAREISVGGVGLVAWYWMEAKQVLPASAQGSNSDPYSDS